MSIRRRLQIEPLDERVVPSLLASTLPVKGGASHFVLQSHALAGNGHGTYFGGSLIVDAGQSDKLQGTADLARLGHVSLSGSVNGLGLIAFGHATGRLTFTNAHGSVTVALQGPLQHGFDPLPPWFQYTVVSGTGDYQHLSDSGWLDLSFQAAAPTTGMQHFGQAHGTFALAIDSVLPSTKLSSGIEGVALVGPVTPVSRIGVPNSRPLAGAILSIQSMNGTQVARVVTAQDGSFLVALPPGRYRIVPLPPQPGAILPRGTPMVVDVSSHEYTVVTINYDSGIR
jgi:hypothetical protein